ncbi:MAG TPA: Gfo/Idh/MocA family oxidoreductase [Fimbriimonadaceae bacterium]|nr:Gfo/Idh/MocA family oxidoreductase [Fimbriimonadaceae bacterium]
MKRREFLQVAGAVGIGTMMQVKVGPENDTAKMKAPKRQGKSMVGYADKPIDKVRVGFIGVGARGSGHVQQMLAIDGVEVVAICDLYKDLAERSAKHCVDAGRKAPDIYHGDAMQYKKMLHRGDMDMVVIATPWEWHVPMSCEAMLCGYHAFCEVPAAYHIEDCWRLVDTAERTKRHYMMLENVNYGREELMVLNMCRLGVFGELLHGEASYIHDLRTQMYEMDRGTGSWRTIHYQTRNGNLYPTHGLGPVSHYLGINRGDRFDYMTSVSSPSRSRAIFLEEHPDKFPPGNKWSKDEFVCGDLNTSILKTVKGKTVMVQWDEQLPRPYTRLNFLQGTKGTWGGFPNRCVIEGVSKSTDTWDQDADLQKFYEKYDHPLWTHVANLPNNQGGHGGMDFVMLWRIVYCLRNGLPLDQDCYDGPTWSAVGPLSEWSVANRGQSIDFPDFTRGAWKDHQPKNIEI